MDIPVEVLLLGGLVIVTVFVLLLSLAGRSRRIGRASSGKADSTPTAVSSSAQAAAPRRTGGVRTTPSRERKREHLAAAFAEQIEDLLRAKLMSDPLLVARNVDLGTAADGSLEIIVDGKSYGDVSQVPDKSVREALFGAVGEWNAGKSQEGGES